MGICRPACRRTSDRPPVSELESVIYFSWVGYILCMDSYLIGSETAKKLGANDMTCKPHSPLITTRNKTPTGTAAAATAVASLEWVWARGARTAVEGHSFRFSYSSA